MMTDKQVYGKLLSYIENEKDPFIRLSDCDNKDKIISHYKNTLGMIHTVIDSLLKEKQIQNFEFHKPSSRIEITKH